MNDADLPRRESPCRWARMITAIGAPTATRLLAAIIPIVARRNGMLQKYVSPSRNGVRRAWLTLLLERACA